MDLEVRPRPAQVTVAFALQLGVAAALLACAGLVTAEAIHYAGLIDEAARSVAGADPAEVADERAFNVANALTVAVPALLIAVWLGIASLGLRRGSDVSRILSVVGLGAPLLLGLIVCCGGGFLAAGFGLALATGGGGEFEGEGDYSEFDDLGDSSFYDKLYSLDSGGFSEVVGAVGSSLVPLAMLMGISTVVLLFTGPANRYFRPRRPVFPPFHGYPPAYWYPPYWYGPLPSPPAAPPEA